MVDPQADDLYPNAGNYFAPSEPGDQKQARKREQAKVLQSKELLNDILAWFDERIVFYTSIDSVPKGVTTNPEEFMHCVAANTLTRDNLQIERERLEGLLEDYAK